MKKQKKAPNKNAVKSNAKPIIWTSKRVAAKLINPTPNNYKIKTDLGRERLQMSLSKYGRAGTVVCNPSTKKKGTFDLIDGNSRWEEVMARDKNEIMEISIPSRPLSPAEYKEMSAMFDFAKAGEVDIDRIQGELGTSQDFFTKWGLEVPMEVLDKLGKKSSSGVEVEYPEEGDVKHGKGKKASVPEVQDTRMVQAFFTASQEAEFRKMEVKLTPILKIDNTTDFIYKCVLLTFKAKCKK